MNSSFMLMMIVPNTILEQYPKYIYTCVDTNTLMRLYTNDPRNDRFPRSRITCQEEMNQTRTCFDTYGYNNEKYPIIPLYKITFFAKFIVAWVKHALITLS